jgi:integrative and conjugative element protein (TIGR02256 family)
MFKTKKSAISVTIARGALESVFDECDRYDVDETGGRLLGTYRTKGAGYEIIVAGVIGPGPNARRSSTSFFQDGDYQEQVFRSIEAKHRDTEHLGNWHTHHVNGFPTLSGGDISTYRNIVNHRNHNTDFFYALLVVRKNDHGNPRYDVKHYFFRRDDEAVYEIPDNYIRVVDLPLLSPADGDSGTPRASTAQPLDQHQPRANSERAKDKDFFADFYPDVRALFSEKLSAPYWKGPLTLIDGSRIDVVAVESADGSTPEYSIVTAGDQPTCAEVLAKYKAHKFTSARHAIIQLERDLNREIYRAKK